MHTQEWGAGDPVVALHPLALESTAFAGIGIDLAREGLRTIAVDLPGFGESEAPPVPHEQLVAALSRFDSWRSDLLGFVTEHPVVVAPVNAAAAYPAGFESTDEILAKFSYTFAYNATGFPVVVVPAGQSDQGLPIGVQIIAGPGREDIALAAAGIVERSLSAYRRPAI